MKQGETRESQKYFSFQEAENEEKETGSAFEKLLNNVGSHGRFQKMLIIGFMIPLAVINSLGSANTNMLLITPAHSCHIPGRPESVTEEEWRNITLPWEENSMGELQPSSCFMYNGTDFNSSIYINSEEQMDLILSPDNTTVQECKHGWDFDRTNWQETPVTQFGWVCSKRHTVATMFSISYAGNAVGTLLFSVISDRIGRKSTFYCVLLMNVLCSVALTFSPNDLAFGALKFLLALCYYTFYQMPYIIVVELCSESLRTFTASSSFIACVTGTCLMSLLAFVSDHWKTFILICHLPSLVFLLYWRVIPESPRWLLSRSRITECEMMLKEIAQVNGREYTERSRHLLMEAQKEEIKKTSLKKILASFVLAKHIVLTSGLLSIGYLLYSGMILNIHNMTGSKVLNYVILQLVEIPGNLIGSISAQYFGRRLSAVTFTLFASACSFLSTFFIRDAVVLAILCAVNKMSSGALVLVIYLQIGELFPTPMRATAYGVTGIVSIAAVTFIPPLIATGSTNALLPYYVLFGIGLLGFVLSTFLPETVGRPLPQTTKEAIVIGKNQPFFSVIHKWNAHLYLDAETKTQTHRERTRNWEKVVCDYEEEQPIT